jgi:hypothetical protein
MADHGGRIDVESPTGPAGGTSFTLAFPALHEEALAACAAGGSRSERR